MTECVKRTCNCDNCLKERERVLAGITDLEHQRDTALEQVQTLAREIVAWREEAATAHVAAIQAAAERIRGIAYDELVVAVLTLIPADAQRLYNLRIAEAVRDEAKTAHDLDWRSWPSHRCLKKLDKSSGWSCRRLASASARVERLKSIIAE